MNRKDKASLKSLWSLTLTDIYSGWTENAAVRHTVPINIFYNVLASNYYEYGLYIVVDQDWFLF